MTVKSLSFQQATVNIFTKKTYPLEIRKSSKNKLEVRFFSTLCLFAMVTCLFTVITNLIINRNLLLCLAFGLASLLFFAFYYLSYYKGIYKSLLIPFYILVLIGLVLNWFYFQGFVGSTPFFILVVTTVLIYSNTSAKYWRILTFFILLSILLIGIQILHPEWLSYYDSKNQWIMDVAIGFIISLMLLGYSTIYLKKEYDREREKTEKRKKELEESEERFRDIALMSGEWIWEIDTNGRFQYCSEKAEEILGISTEYLIGKPFWLFLLEEDVEESKFFLNQIILNPQTYKNKELLFKGCNGEKIIIYGSGRPLFDAHGKVQGYRGINIDVTLKKEQEASSFLQQYYLQTLMENIPDTIYFKDRQSRFLKINKALATMFGLDNPEDAKGKTDADFFGVEHAAETYRDEQSIIRSGIPVIGKEEQETWSYKPATWVSSTKMPLYNDKNIIIGTFGISRNITESKMMTEAIEKRILALTKPMSKDDPISFDDLFNLENIQLIQDQFSKVAGVASIITLPDGTPITKPSNFTRFCNDIVRKTSIGCQNCHKSDSKLGSPNTDGPTISHCLSGGLWDAGATILVGDSHVANWLIGQVRDESQNEDGIRKYATTIGVNEDELVDAFYEVPSMSLSRFTDVSNTLFTLANNLSDMAYQNLQQARFITERKQAEEALKQNEALLKELNATKDRFFSIIAHDLKSPFNSILGFSELLKSKLEENDTQKASEYCNVIQQSARNTMDLLINLLDWARSQTSKMEFKPTKLDLIDLINKNVEIFELAAKHKNIQLQLDIPKTAMLVADVDMLSTILRNLISNAIKFTKADGVVIVRVQNLKDQWKVSVVDNGVGMTIEEQQKLFRIEETFSTNGTNGEHGTGLGLILCKEFVTKHKGTIGVESEPDRGSTFYFFLPNIL